MHFSYFIGVDISKNTLDVAIYPAKDRNDDFLHIENTSKGLRTMITWIKRKGIKTGDVVICAEHTGIYTNPLIDYLDKKGIALSLNSPLEIKRSMGIIRGKSDAVDAARIAEYAFTKREKLRIYEKPSDSVMALQYLLTERRQYVRQRAALLNMQSALINMKHQRHASAMNKRSTTSPSS